MMAQDTFIYRAYLDDEDPHQTEVEVTYRVLSAGTAPTHSYDPFIYDPGAAAEIEILSCVSWSGHGVTLDQAQRDRIAAEIERYDQEQWASRRDPDEMLERDRENALLGKNW